SAERIQLIQQNIDSLHPDASSELKQQILEIAIKAIENQIFVEGGSFMMGDFGMKCKSDRYAPTWEEGTECYATFYQDDKPAHKVTLTSYSLSKYETSLYEKERYHLAYDLPLPYPKMRKKKPNHWTLNPKIAAGTGSWQEAKDQCLWLGSLTGYAFDLPTEAQWEFAARNRGQKIFYATNDGTIVRDVNTPTKKVFPVDSFPPSPLGFHHLQSNVTEWVNDWFDDKYYQHSPEYDPQGPEKPPIVKLTNKNPGHFRIVRGGNTSWSPTVMTNRAPTPPRLSVEYSSGTGFRCAVQSPTPVY
ncbi:MAG: formylglycine-generating enzyme family protein, partial [Cellvibrionaceae bacterium]|nr:formylglycine-generating enzyme family protein [Cellvibrionaceae bacterium]